jgi:carbonic anhydrase/acetyltransferase-like protein (isoleucine patch superfamily)
MIRKSPRTDFCGSEYLTDAEVSAVVYSLSAVIGHVIIEKTVFVAPFALVRGDEGHPFALRG